MLRAGEDCRWTETAVSALSGVPLESRSTAAPAQEAKPVGSRVSDPMQAAFSPMAGRDLRFAREAALGRWRGGTAN
jgi:hypothetical protein